MIDLILTPVAAALVILSIHAYLGLHVLAREVIFVDLAFAQIAAMGTTLAFLMGIEAGTAASLLFALSFTLVGALIFSFTRLEDSPVPQEAIIGITYVVASAAVLLMASLSAEGAEHVHETLTGTLIWVDWKTILWLVAAYALIGAIHWLFRRQLLAVSFAPEKASRLYLWDFVFYLTFGIVISFSVSVAGVLMVFSLLVIPGVIAFLFTNRFSVALVVAWLVGAVTILSGTAISFVWDLTTGPLLVCAFGVSLIVAGLIRVLSGARTERKIRVASLETAES
jgi:zinc/manganese transport system permease protein